MSLNPFKKQFRSFFARLTAAVFLISIFVTTQSTAPLQATTSSQSFALTRAFEDWVVPSGVTSLSFVAKGSMSTFGGYGAYVAGTITVTPGETLRIYVGGPGNSTSGTGGYPNGGAGGGTINQLTAFGGGGSTHIVETDDNQTPIVVAGGGGGGTNYGVGGAGGYVGDDAPRTWSTYPQLDGRGGTQTAGGAPTCVATNDCNQYTAGLFMQGGEGYYGAGGGGGYYGGSAGNGFTETPQGGSSFDYGGAGGGGSSYVDPTRLVGMAAPTYHTGWSDGPGSLTITWTPSATPTTTPITTPTTAPPISTNEPTTPPTLSPTTSPVTQAPSATAVGVVVSTTTTTPSSIAPPVTPPGTQIVQWSPSDVTESETPIIGASPFPTSGKGTVLVTSEMGYSINTGRQFIPRWRTRVYIGPVALTLKATYTIKSKRRTWQCRLPSFGTTAVVPNSNNWRTYQPPRGCILPADLYSQLKSRAATMSLTGTFNRRWATTGKLVRRDGSKITPRRISLRIGQTDSVTLS